MGISPRVIFEDDFLVVVDKPAGTTVNRARTVTARTVQEWHWDRLGRGEGEGEFWQKGGVVHRLDRDTSGVMVLAKTPQAYEGLKTQFLERRTNKTYLALVHGHLGESEGVITEPVERHPKSRMRFAVGSDPARAAITEWKVKGQYAHPRGVPYTLLEVRPLTGRTHQIRVHMKHIHHPIVSDPIYGGRKQYREDIKWCPRLWLHAQSLAFVHPGTGKKVKFESGLPEDLETALNSLIH